MVALLGGDVLSLGAYVQLPQHVSDEFLHVLMNAGVEDDAHAVIIFDNGRKRIAYIYKLEGMTAT